MRIELDATILLKFCDNNFERKSLPIRAVCCHRINRIRNHDDAGAKWNILFRHPIRIPFPIPPFMVMSNHQLHIPPEGSKETDKLSTLLRVRLHNLPFFWCKSTIFL